eukprot:TRINITY_DN66403_c0_g1_i2.p1 TRINITY_DN66403_c0_g1~~TRINITY_DN66403_c0_g1_i2.p1  ORF type:complete len:360 (+),score=51.91 TRINITY_DN66403_c0_g1_i2:37-1116(+)
MQLAIRAVSSRARLSFAPTRFALRRPRCLTRAAAAWQAPVSWQQRCIASATRKELKTVLGVDDEDVLRMCKRHAELLHVEPDIIRRNVAFLKGDAGLESAAALASAARQFPVLLTADVSTVMRPALTAIAAVVPAGLLADVVKHCPDALLSSPDAIHDLHQTLQALGAPFEKLIKRTPRIIVQKAATVQQLHTFLVDPKDGPGMDSARAVSVLTKFPMLLVGTRNLTRQLAPLVKFLREDLAVDPASDDCIGFYAWPDALSTIRPNVTFLCGECGYRMEDLKDSVTLLAYSFESRLFPRVMWVKTCEAPMPSLWTLMGADDRMFAQVVGPSYEAYHEFFKELRKSGAARAWIASHVAGV